jgi:hypothetical protein
MNPETAITGPMFFFFMKAILFNRFTVSTAICPRDIALPKISQKWTASARRPCLYSESDKTAFKNSIPIPAEQ